MTARISVLMLLAFLVAVPSYGGGQVWTSASDRNKGWLGVETQDVTGRLRDRKHLAVDAGAYVSNVIEDSPAESAGIQEGDVITKVDGTSIDDADDLLRAIRKIKPDTEAKIEIDRKGERKTLTATIERSREAEEFSFRFDGGRQHRFVMPPMPKMPDLSHLRHSLRVLVDQQSHGLQLQELTKQLAEYFQVPSGYGLLVAGVTKGSSAEQAGFRAGDVIVKLDGETVRDMEDFHDAVQEAGSGKEIPCEVVRKGKTESLKWKLADDEDDYSFATPACPPVPPAACEAPQAAAPAGLKARLEEVSQLVMERVAWLKDMLAALWRPIEQKFS